MIKLIAQDWPDIASRSVWRRLLGIDNATLYRAQKIGKLKAYGSERRGRPLYRRQDIAAWIGVPDLPQADGQPEAAPKPPQRAGFHFVTADPDPRDESFLQLYRMALHAMIAQCQSLRTAAIITASSIAPTEWRNTVSSVCMGVPPGMINC
jgi:hypothetical protein